MPARKSKRTGTNAKKSRGAQPANVNALKHGFYSPRFLADETKDLDGFSDETLASELAMMRVATRRVLNVLSTVRSVDKNVALLGALGAASSRVAGLLKTRKFLAGGGGDLGSALEQALHEVAEELKLAS